MEGSEVGPVLLQGLVHLGRAEVVGEGEGEAEQAGQLGAEGGRSEQPGLGEVAPPGDRGRMGGRPVAVHQVVDQLDHVVGKGVRPLSPVPAQGAGGGRIGARGAAQAEIDPPRVEGLEGGELFGDDQRGVIGQHHPTGPDPQGGGGVGQVPDEDGRCRAGHRRHAVVLRHPQTVVAEPLDHRGQPGGVGQGVGGGEAVGHGGQVEDGERHHVPYNTGPGRLLPRRDRAQSPGLDCMMPPSAKMVVAVR